MSICHIFSKKRIQENLHLRHQEIHPRGFPFLPRAFLILGRGRTVSPFSYNVGDATHLHLQSYEPQTQVSLANLLHESGQAAQNFFSQSSRILDNSFTCGERGSFGYTFSVKNNLIGKYLSENLLVIQYSTAYFQETLSLDNKH